MVQALGGCLGVLLGPRLVGSALVGLILGIAGATALVGSTSVAGMWARELGWQSAEKVRELREKLSSNTPPLRSAVAGLLAEVAEGLRAMDKALGARAKLWALWLRCWTPVKAKADATGLSQQVASLWAASALPAWLEQCSANIEKRRANVQGV